MLIESSGSFPNSAAIAPLSQPNYTFLRLDSALIEPDVVPYHDLHNASPAGSNPRLTDLATGNPRVERQGVYLHWMLPKCYRSGSAEDTNNDTQDLRAPQFRAAPDRWLVVRRLHPGSFLPANVVQQGLMKELTAWVVESNRLRNLQEFGREIDIELECAPYITGSSNTDSQTATGSTTTDTLEGQAEIFVGRKTLLDQWTEEAQSNPSQFVPLDVLGAANPLLADYTPHNPNVFSMLDNFCYPSSGTATGYLTQAEASYYVIGWHSSSNNDPMINPSQGPLSSILSNLKLDLKLPPGDDPKKPSININSWKSTRTTCHGAMYNVKYFSSGSPDVTIPANDAAKKLSDPQSHPVTVGTTPLDAILAYVRSHLAEEDIAGVPATSDLRTTETDILHLETLLLKQDEDVDAQQEALDMLSANNFQPAQDNGGHWSFSAASAPGKPTTTSRTTDIFTPTTDQITSLAKLNAAQMTLDAAKRELQNERWNLFALWWKYVADSTELNANLGNVNQATSDQRDIVNRLVARIVKLEAIVQTCLVPFPVLDSTGKRMVAKGSQPRFYFQKDPTILVPGIPNPWPNDWMTNLQVRLSSQIQPQALPSSLPSGWTGLNDLFGALTPTRIPTELKNVVQILISEFFNLHPPNDKNDTWVEQPSKIGPLYHDHVQPDQTIAPGLDAKMNGRDQWSNTQAWFPLFLEWEARYYHIPWGKWAFEEKVDVDPIPGNPLHTRYGLDANNASVQGLTGDERTIKGRVLILPQPGFNLSINIQQLFLATAQSDLPPELQSSSAMASFLTAVQQLEYLSAPMAGFMDHLVTKLSGTHIKPSVRMPGKPITPLQAAVTSSARAGFVKNDIKLMDIETTQTPYANYVEFNPTIAPLKSVTHGQFKFTRLDVFDKFGQAISAINPAPASHIPPLYPALSEYFHPQHLPSDRKQAFTVGDNPYGTCQYAQYPPAINQDARINASFLHFDDQIKLWRPCTEWENPVWGYLVVNYAEYALQIFLPTGEFYREVRLGGPLGASAQPAWKPFEMPTDRRIAADHPQLDNLLTQLQDKDYLRSFINVVNQSLASVAHAPNTYADFLNAIVGRPLALVNMGFSLELAQPPLKNQSTQSTAAEPFQLLDLVNPYKFKVKVGDKDRVYDGLVGYFDSQDNFEALGTELKLDTLYTYYDTGTKLTQAISPVNYPIIKPYYISAAQKDTLVFDDPTLTDDAAVQLALGVANQHAQNLKMLGCIIDPFSDVHLYSGILPIVSLKLPPWTLQQAMQTMTAFFHMGPLLITTPDLQNQFDPAHDQGLPADYNLAAPTAPTPPVDPTAPPAFKGIPIPAVKSADWNWLQAFAFRPTTAPTSSGTTAQAAPGSLLAKEQKWKPFVIAQLDNKPKFEQGPYTAVEGYLQLKNPIMTPGTE